MSKKQLNLSTIVMSRIQKENIIMKPKWYFVLGSIFMTLGVIGSAVITMFLVSLISFSLKTHGPMGEIRYQQLLSSFPWWAPVLATVGLGFGILLLRTYDFSYKKNFLFIVTVFIVAIISSGLFLDYLGLDKIWSQQGPMRGLYQRYDGGWRGGLGNGRIKNNIITTDSESVDVHSEVNPNQLPNTVIEAIDEALSDEYKALSTYEAVIQKFGQVRPFSMIKTAEEQHIASLLQLYKTYGLSPPDNRWSNSAIAPESIQKACQAGVEAELANAALYKEKLIPQVSSYPDIKNVFTALMNASEQKHLPAFKRCN